MAPDEEVMEIERDAGYTGPEYYAELTDLIQNNTDSPLDFHLGLYGPDTKNEPEAMARSTQVLTQGFDLRPGKLVLDAGCGLGGEIIALAQQFGISAVGLTNCEPHVEVATEHAHRRGVGHLVEFKHGDFHNPPFEAETFDYVISHEAYCGASDVRVYCEGMLRVLKPGGRWQGIEGLLLSDKPLTESQEKLRYGAQRGFIVPPWLPWRQAVQAFEDVGFEDIRVDDLVAEVLPSVKRFKKVWAQLAPWLIPPGGKRSYEDFMNGGIAFGKGLKDGVFTYKFISAKKPS